MSEWNEILIGKREFQYFEIINGKLVVSFVITPKDPKKCLHLQTIENRNCTAASSICVECGKNIMDITLYMDGRLTSGVFAT